MKISEAVGNDSKGSMQDGNNGTVPGRNVQGSGSVGVNLWKRELGGECEMLRVLTAFHHQVAKRITGMAAKCGTGIEWEYAEVDEEMEYKDSTPSEYT